MVQNMFFVITNKFTKLSKRDTLCFMEFKEYIFKNCKILFSKIIYMFDVANDRFVRDGYNFLNN